MKAIEKSRLLDKLIKKEKKGEKNSYFCWYAVCLVHKCLFGTDFYPSAISQTSSLFSIDYIAYTYNIQHTYKQSHLRHFGIHFSTFLWTNVIIQFERSRIPFLFFPQTSLNIEPF